MTVTDVKNLRLNDLLGAVGLQRRQGSLDVLLPAVGLFAAGLVVGCGIGMLFAPKQGTQLRQDLGERLRGREPLQAGLQQPVGY